MDFLDKSRWEGRIYSDGWVPGLGGEYDAIEPASGRTLARVGAAADADVHQAAGRSALAQREWAVAPYDQRAAALRRAGQLFLDHGREIEDWTIRESGATRPFAAVQAHVAAEECFEAAALASHPYGNCCEPAGRGCRCPAAFW